MSAAINHEGIGTELVAESTFSATERAAKAISGTTGGIRDDAISAFLRAAMVFLLVG